MLSHKMIMGVIAGSVAVWLGLTIYSLTAAKITGNITA